MIVIATILATVTTSPTASRPRPASRKPSGAQHRATRALAPRMPRRLVYSTPLPSWIRDHSKASLWGSAVPHPWEWSIFALHARCRRRLLRCRRSATRAADARVARAPAMPPRCYMRHARAAARRATRAPSRCTRTPPSLGLRAPLVSPATCCGATSSLHGFEVGGCAPAPL